MKFVHYTTNGPYEVIDIKEDHLPLAIDEGKTKEINKRYATLLSMGLGTPPEMHEWAHLPGSIVSLNLGRCGYCSCKHAKEEKRCESCGAPL